MTPDETEIAARDTKRPTLILLGEFSAGKSTLANLLLGVSQSTVRVTATQAPPVWYVPGVGVPVLIASDGSETAVPGRALADVNLQDTRAIRVPVQAEILESVTIIDMPGSSDPNMSPDIWDALLPKADIAIWCTPATQAWRQSEAAIWDMVPDTLKERSLLLLTRMDKITSRADQSRILSRVARETRGLFRAVLPVSLLNASLPLAQCEASGMQQVMGALSDVMAGPSVAPAAPSALPRPDLAPAAGPTQARPQIVPRRVSAQPQDPQARIVRRAVPQRPAT